MSSSDERAAFEGQLLALAREFANKYSGASNANQLQAEIDFCKALREFNPRTTAPQATVRGDERDRVRDAIAEAIGGDAYDCTRVWTAWSVGTMSEDDFSAIVSDESRLYEIADAAIRAAVPQAGAPNDAAITACALMIKGICMTLPQDQWSRKIEERIRFMLATPQG